MGFPDGSDGKESAYNAGDLGSIPLLGRSPGGGHGNPFLPGEFPWTEEPSRLYSPRGGKESDMAERLSSAVLGNIYSFYYLCRCLETCC